MVKDVLIAGIYDVEIRRDILSTPDILNKSTNDIISLVEAKETARNAMPGSAAAMSTFKREQRKDKAPENVTPSSKSQTSPCPDCGKTYSFYTEGASG